MGEKIVRLYQPQMSYAAEIVEVSTLFFNEHPVLDEATKEVLAGETVPTVLKAFKEQLTQMEVVDAPTVKAKNQSSTKRNRGKRKEPVYADPCRCFRTNAWT